jgi:hypothetical protein
MTLYQLHRKWLNNNKTMKRHEIEVPLISKILLLTYVLVGHMIPFLIIQSW